MMAQRYISSSSEPEDQFIQYLQKESKHFTRKDESHSKDRRDLCRRRSNSASKSPHRITRNKQNRFQCDKCPFSTIYRDLGRHMKKHKEARFSCDICNMPFMARGFLNSHKLSMHGIEREPYQRVYKCSECDYTTIHSSDISRHRRRHEFAVHSCRLCNRPFHNAANLVTHMEREHENSNASKRRKRQSEPRCCTGKGKRYKTDIKYRDGYHTKADTRSVNDRSSYKAEKRGKSKCSETEVEDTSSESDHKSDANNDDNETELAENEEGDKREHRTVKEMRSDCITENSESDNDSIIKTKLNRSKENGEVKYDKCAKKSLHEKKTNDEYFETVKLSTEVNCNKGVRVETDVRKLTNCAFCEFSAVSLKALQKHLDDHDYDMDLSVCTDNVPVSEDSINSLLDSRTLSRTNAISDDENNELLNRQDVNTLSDTSYERDSLFQKNERIEKQVENADCGKHINVKEGSTESHSELNYEESSDVLDIFSRCKATLDGHKSDEFKMRPFACSNCFYTTGNLEHLKIHVEAHLYDNISTYVKRRDFSDSSVMELPERNNEEYVKIIGREEQFPVDRRNSNKTNLALVYNQTEIDRDDDVILPPYMQMANQHDTEFVSRADNGLAGRLRKDDFRKHRRCYKEHSVDGCTTFECLICETGNHFDSKVEIKRHFRKKHKKLREKVCKTCSHCSSPFP